MYWISIFRILLELDLHPQIWPEPEPGQIWEKIPVYLLISSLQSYNITLT